MTHLQSLHLCAQARAIAHRLAPLPTGDAANGWAETERFVSRCRQRAEHERVYRREFARLADAAAGEAVERELRATMRRQG